MTDLRGILAADSDDAKCDFPVVNGFVGHTECGVVGIVEAVEEMPVSAELLHILPDFPVIWALPLKFGGIECQEIEVKVIQKITSFRGHYNPGGNKSQEGRIWIYDEAREG